jgi:hypothetical protein
MRDERRDNTNYSEYSSQIHEIRETVTSTVLGVLLSAQHIYIFYGETRRNFFIESWYCTVRVYEYNTRSRVATVAREYSSTTQHLLASWYCTYKKSSGRFSNTRTVLDYSYIIMHLIIQYY